jgi:chitinase domain-containing protein 1
LIWKGFKLVTAMRVAAVCVILIAAIATVSSTLNPSKNKKGKQKTEKVVNVKINKGPQEKSVYDRNLVDNEPLASAIISEAHTYYHDTSLKNFNGTVLGYVTPVIETIFILSTFT